ncbi:MAG: right-handed parallel beta-helix repeat-containing protein [bacterium]
MRSSGSSPTFTSCIISGNSAMYGGGVSCLYSSPTFTNCTISVNSAYDGGGVYCDGSSPTFTNCTLNGDSAYLGGGGVFCWGSSPTFHNTIIAFSSGTGICLWNSAESQILYCDIFGNSGGAFGGSVPTALGQLVMTNANGDSCDQYFNIFLDPMFVDTAVADFHLRAGSPCIDAGDPTMPLDPDSTVADIGAFYFDQSAVEPLAVLLPKACELHPNWPNPFNSRTMIRYDVPQAGEVSLTIFNLLGQRVTTLFDGRQLAGSYTIAWDAANLPSGVYLCRMNAGSFAKTRKMVVVK